jgi:hypothetical protein
MPCILTSGLTGGSRHGLRCRAVARRPDSRHADDGSRSIQQCDGRHDGRDGIPDWPHPLRKSPRDRRQRAPGPARARMIRNHRPALGSSSRAMVCSVWLVVRFRLAPSCSVRCRCRTAECGVQGRLLRDGERAAALFLPISRSTSRFRSRRRVASGRGSPRGKRWVARSARRTHAFRCPMKVKKERVGKD